MMETETVNNNIPRANKDGESETFKFAADIGQLMSLIVNTFYSKQEIFLRELISNASDALDKIRYESLTCEDRLGNCRDLIIRLIPDKESKCLIIEDTGIGMTKEDLIKNLGTIAHSGTGAFIEKLQAGADLSMIGQFGVGFYAAFLVADRVSVISKHNDDVQWRWDSSAGGSFVVTRDTNDDILRGTRIVLHLKPDRLEYLEERRLRDIVKEHSEFINYPIYIRAEKQVEREIDDEDTPMEEEQQQQQQQEGATPSEDSKKKIKIKETVFEMEHLNKTRPLWVRLPDEITPEEYSAFYKSTSGDWEDHLTAIHFNVEGQIDLKALLFIPKRAPFDMFESHKKRQNIKLYVRRVFVMDITEDILPDYMSFVKGVLDSDDLPLSISREQLPRTGVFPLIKKNVIKRIFETLNNMATDKPEDYSKFYEQFSKNIKLGIHEDTKNRVALSKLLRFKTSKSKGQLISLQEYVDRMKENQKDIYYITGESEAAVENNPCLEAFKRLGYEVFYMTDPIDEYATQPLKDFEGHKLRCITKENIDLLTDDESKKKFEDAKAALEPLCKTLKEILGDKVEKVVVGTRCAQSPCALVTSEYGWSANMERIMKAQALRDHTLTAAMTSRRTLELNPYHPMIQALKVRNEAGSFDLTMKDIVSLLYRVSMLASGFTLEDPQSLADPVYRMISIGLGVESTPGDVPMSSEPMVDSEIEEVETTRMEDVD